MVACLSDQEIASYVDGSASAEQVAEWMARDTELDRVVGLEVGADDYITKPFSMRELLARVASTLRRVAMDRAAAVHRDDKEILEFDGLTIDVVRRQVSVDGEPVELRPREFDLLAYLASHPGRPFTRDALLADVSREAARGVHRLSSVELSFRLLDHDATAC